MPRLEDDPHSPLSQLVEDEVITDQKSSGLSLNERRRLVAVSLPARIKAPARRET